MPMPVGQKALLETVINAVNNWHAAAQGVGVDLDQLNLRLPPVEEGAERASIVFAWDQETEQYRMTT